LAAVLEVDPTVFAVDLWRFQQALAAARRAQLDPAVAAAGRPTAECCWRAPYAWVAAPREDLAGGRSTRWRGWPEPRGRR